ncbi:eCIS core domain-containing protein [Planktothrix paucivesiculata]|uniref:eCIS core domain-containing protein n=1 Tax=Planktothrix paucivesiculata PCC 9631 TaxID=671071 RepID=A0A7Z9E4N1_9CYAN|nr:DUF4157 domain-containing protein [Planktothrix paucivesiculata]VXD24522.1 hypothetical protein PL9631_810031 [Planktothrix paucivesiculata PCC 9631]
MKMQLKKQNRHQEETANQTAIQAKSLTDIRPMDNALAAPQKPQTEDAKNPQVQKKQGFNFAEIPISGKTEGSAARIQPKFNLSLQKKLTVGQAGDKYEQEADSVAEKVVKQINTPTTEKATSSKGVQRQEEEEVQAKPNISDLQRQGEEEEEVQAKPNISDLQREGEEEEEVQAKSDSSAIQREGEEEEEVQAKADSSAIQREGEEEEEVQAKADSSAIQREGEEEEEVQAKSDSSAIQREGEEEEEVQAKADSSAIQREGEEEEEVQAKADSSAIQREGEEEEEIQAKPQNKALGGGAVSTDIETTIQSAKSGGSPLDAGLRRKMGKAMGADFSGVKVHTDSQSDKLNRSLSSRAFATGPNLFFKRGEYNPGSRSGQELIAHELTHVVQQGAGRVDRPQRKETTIMSKVKAVQRKPLKVMEITTGANSNSYQPLQRKVLDIRPLDDSTVTTKTIGQTRTEQIQKGITTYNKIPAEDTQYSQQEEDLKNLNQLVKGWLADNQQFNRAKPKNETDKNNKKRYNDLDRARDELNKEWDRVQTQRRESGQLKGGKSQQDTKGELKKYFGEQAKEQAKEKFGDDAKKKAEAVGKETEGFLKDLQKTVPGKEKASSLATDGLTSAIGHIPFLGSIGNLLKSIDSVRDNYAAMEALNTAKSNAVSEELQEATKHGYGKVRRRFLGSVGNVVGAIIDIIGDLLLVTGVGALGSVIISLGRGVITLVHEAFTKVKGLYKLLKGTKGVHREESAKRIIEKARLGEQPALELLVKLNPMGYTDKPLTTETMSTKLKGDQITHEQLNQFIEKLAGQLKSQNG